MDIIPYGRQEITPDDIAAVVATLQSDYLTQGPKIGEFEEAFAAYVGARFAVAVCNGTAALHLAAMALGVNQATRVLTTPITFAASANCVRYCGGQVEFVDVRPSDATLDLDLLEEHLSKTPKGTYQGVIPVDFAGSAVDLERCRDIADRYGLWILEDACHAPGGYFVDRHGDAQGCGNGKFAEAAIFSFHPVKHIACGEGGIITTNDPRIYKRLLKLRTHGITRDPAELRCQHEGGWYYEMQELGFNYRLTDFQAALGLSQLSRAREGLARRRALAARYLEAFRGSPVGSLGDQSPQSHAYHLYIILVEQRRALYDFLRSRQIFAQVHYVPVHRMPYYLDLGLNCHCPQADKYYEECLSLPMYPSMTEAQQDRVIESVLGFYNRKIAD